MASQRKRCLIFNGLHGVICQKIAVFITTSARITDPANPTLHIYSSLESFRSADISEVHDTSIFKSRSEEDEWSFVCIEVFVLHSVRKSVGAGVQPRPARTVPPWVYWTKCYDDMNTHHHFISADVYAKHWKHHLHAQSAKIKKQK
jgi:hypothetical protein